MKQMESPLEERSKKGEKANNEQPLEDDLAPPASTFVSDPAPIAVPSSHAPNAKSPFVTPITIESVQPTPSIPQSVLNPKSTSTNSKEKKTLT